MRPANRSRGIVWRTDMEYFDQGAVYCGAWGDVDYGADDETPVRRTVKKTVKKAAKKVVKAAKNVAKAVAGK